MLLQDFLIATQNAGKVREFRRLLDGLGIDFVGLSDLEPVDPPAEGGSTFIENATLKAIFYSRRFRRFAIADDSGLVVDALDGAPGVHSARYGGDSLTDADRTQLLLHNLRDVPTELRTARFVCCIVVASPDTEKPMATAEGVVEGRITFSPRGGKRFRIRSGFRADGSRPHDRRDVGGRKRRD